jgi:hypothetical protein
MKTRKRLLIMSFLFIIITGNFSRIIGKNDVSTLVFLSIFAWGAISALFLREAIVAIRNR